MYLILLALVLLCIGISGNIYIFICLNKSSKEPQWLRLGLRDDISRTLRNRLDINAQIPGKLYSDYQKTLAEYVKMQFYAGALSIAVDFRWQYLLFFFFFFFFFWGGGGGGGGGLPEFIHFTSRIMNFLWQRLRVTRYRLFVSYVSPKLFNWHRTTKYARNTVMSVMVIPRHSTLSGHAKYPVSEGTNMNIQTGLGNCYRCK